MLKFEHFPPLLYFQPFPKWVDWVRKFRPPEFLTVHSAAGSPQSRL